MPLRLVTCRWLLSVVAWGVLWGPAAAGELDVLPADPPPAEMLTRWLKPLCHQALAKRQAAYEKLKTPEDLARWQKERREFFWAQLGPMPERTPLEAKVVNASQRDGYRLETVLFQSQPQHYVTGALFLPASELKARSIPGCIVPCGHSANGKAAEPYQRVCILLAKNGIAAFCYDPIGQGERYQILAETGKPRFGPTTEHTLVGVGSMLVGRNTATYRVWDGLRAMDYLESRPEIDPQRLGCLGNSGGGTLTSYLMALDDRIACAAPSCYLTTFGRLLDTLGPQDAEQNIYGQIGFGFDHPDYVLLRAPKPTLMCAATHDFFDIQGTWDNFRQAKRFYTRLGFSERVDLVETDAKHGLSVQLRVAAVRWMRRWLLERYDPIEEPAFEVVKEAELLASPTGQVMQIAGARSVIDLNAELARKLAAGRQTLWEKGPAIQAVRKLAGIRPAAELPAPKVEKAGSITRSGYRIDKLRITAEPGITLPALAFVPEAPAKGATLYLHGGGKQAHASADGPIEALVRQGQLVLAVDLRGLGESAPVDKKGEADPIGPEFVDVYLAYLLGKSLVGPRAEDVLTSAAVAASYELPAGQAPRSVRLVAIGAAGVPALHAAATEPERFERVQLEQTLRAWEDVLGSPAAKRQLAQAVHGALTGYDLPDLVASLGKKITVVQPAE